MVHELKNVGLKITGPRIKILNIMQTETGNGTHLSAEDVYKILLNQNDEVGLATVYRVLTQFEQAGILKRHNFEGNQSVFEIDNGEHHDHLICMHCGKVTEFCDPDIERRQNEIAEQHHYTLADHSLVLYGVCDNCHEKIHNTL